MTRASRLAPLALLLAAACARGPAPEPPRLGRLTAFSLEAAGASQRRALSSEDLRGRPWVADFVFTSCSGPCPVLSANMAGLQKRLPSAVALVSFTVDPARDTPAVLEAYARRLGAESGRWLFATGERRELARLMGEGFRLPLAEDARAPSGERIAHSTKFVLVDAGLEVRGYYDGTDVAELRRLVRDAETLVPKSL